MTVGPEFFQTMRIPLLQGRQFKPEEYELTARPLATSSLPFRKERCSIQGHAASRRQR
jgi:hypothetical protein